MFRNYKSYNSIFVLAIALSVGIAALRAYVGCGYQFAPLDAWMFNNQLSAYLLWSIIPFIMLLLVIVSIFKMPKTSFLAGVALFIIVISLVTIVNESNESSNCSVNFEKSKHRMVSDIRNIKLMEGLYFEQFGRYTDSFEELVKVQAGLVPEEFSNPRSGWSYTIELVGSDMDPNNLMFQVIYEGRAIFSCPWGELCQESFPEGYAPPPR